MDFTPLVKARIALAVFWKEAAFKGRCWGAVRNGGRMARSHITLGTEEEVVTVNQSPEGKLIVHEFVRAKRTILGDGIRAQLINSGLEVEEAPP